ncbi:DUF6883 domain-containing protein [Myxacorys almedinensis]|uniref:DUF6883 domain-containing protein n=1 Tax=Myxacorys almedinensis A TaxID=2690445 RepID=A0A8J7Z3Y8_9CYAN|nr:DUF6883 domain-containing protein [Myxacorys almedinensis]NDJ17693.1 hypothetical protein [Myxacorys almedinensis A]
MKKLPLEVQDRKLTEYLLIYQPKYDKSIFLSLAGYTPKNWQILKQDILEAVEESDFSKPDKTQWGKRFTIGVEWAAPNGHLLKVITIWQQDEGAEVIRFVTLYPDKSQEN